MAVPIARENDGLAMSSRNVNLNPEERDASVVLYQALQAAKIAYDGGERNGDALRLLMKEIISAQPLASIDYMSCADPSNLQELEVIASEALISLAIYIGKTRLIDNLILEK